MEEVAKSVFNAPVGTIFVLAGVIFLFIAVIGKISGKIEPGLKARVLSGVLGSVFISIGLAMNWSSGPIFKPPIAGGENPHFNQPTPKPITPPDSTVDNIPDWVPVYPAKVENLSIKTSDGGGQYGGFFFITDDSPFTVLSFYQNNLTIKRWQVTKAGQDDLGRKTAEEYSLSSANDGGSRSITVVSERLPNTVPERWKYVVAFSEYRR